MHLRGLLFSSASFGAWSLVLWCCVSGPGISSYASDPAQAGESLQGCLEEALALIPKAKHQQTPMFLGATGGMRLLRCGGWRGPARVPGVQCESCGPGSGGMEEGWLLPAPAACPLRAARRTALRRRTSSQRSARP